MNWDKKTIAASTLALGLAAAPFTADAAPAVPAPGESLEHQHHILPHIGAVEETDAILRQQFPAYGKEPEIPAHRASQ